MKFYVTRSVSTRNPNTGRTISINKGDRVSETVYNKVSKSLQEKCFIPCRNLPRSTDMTPQQCNFLVTQYVNGVSQQDIINEFYKGFPEREGNGGVECQLRIISGQDNTTDDSGLQNPGKNLLGSMMTVCPHRFV